MWLICDLDRALSNFDYSSFNLGLYQEWIELDLFNYGLVRFSDEEFAEAGLGPAETSLLRYMAQQEQGHAQLVRVLHIILLTHIDISIQFSSPISSDLAQQSRCATGCYCPADSIYLCLPFVVLVHL